MIEARPRRSPVFPSSQKQAHAFCIDGRDLQVIKVVIMAPSCIAPLLLISAAALANAQTLYWARNVDACVPFFFRTLANRAFACFFTSGCHNLCEKAHLVFFCCLSPCRICGPVHIAPFPPKIENPRPAPFLSSQEGPFFNLCL